MGKTTAIGKRPGGRVLTACLSAAQLLFLALTMCSAMALEPRGDLTERQRLLFDLGVGQLATEWLAAPADDMAFDGLGPLFSARSCLACHGDGGVSPGPRFAKGASDLARRLSFLIEPPDPVLGSHIQDLSSAGPAEPLPRAIWMPVQKGKYELTKPEFVLSALRPGRAISGRIALPLAGLGELDRIPDAAINANADPDDADDDGISGRVNRIAGKGGVRPGRFGWRAERVSLADQTMHALSRDMGLSSPAFPDHAGDCTKAQTACRAGPHGADGVAEKTEVPRSVVEQMVFAIRYAAAPAGTGDPNPAGRAVFERIGCTACHRPKIDPARQSVAAYTDLLLHDMGIGLAVVDDTHRVVESEWRTAPLMGLGARLKSAEPGLLHDGRAITVKEAVLWHGGEAIGAVSAFEGLTESAKASLFGFLASL